MKTKYFGGVLAVSLTLGTLVLTACGSGETFVGNGTTDVSQVGDSGDVEPNNELNEAKEIGLNAPITGSANNLSDVADTFSFTPSADGDYTVTLSDMGTNDLDLTVYLSDQSYFPVDDAPVDGPSEIVTVPMTAGLIYYIVVVAFDTAGEAGPYSLVVQ